MNNASNSTETHSSHILLDNVDRPIIAFKILSYSRKGKKYIFPFCYCHKNIVGLDEKSNLTPPLYFPPSLLTDESTENKLFKIGVVSVNRA